MKRYMNLNGKSSVVAYEYDDTSIRVVFKNRKCYEYQVGRIGSLNFQTMKQRADQGRGLCGFISKNVQKSYSSKQHYYGMI